MSKFDLERALKGEPVVLRDGTKAYIRHHETQVKTAYPLIGYMADVKTEGNIMSWAEDGRAFWDREGSVGDIVGMWTEPLKFEYWHLLNEDIKYLAKDWGGEWYGYEGKPTLNPLNRWSTTGGYSTMRNLNKSIFPDCDWKNSLIERPEK